MSYPESNEQFNRQQGEELIAALTGEEAPDLGYPATNEQFNREQGNRLIEAVKNFSPEIPETEAADIGKILGVVSDGEEGAKYELVEDGGLPDPSSLPDGTAMVAVNGEWKMQEGYGYTDSLTVHQFDEELIPSVIPSAPSENGAYVLTCTITNGEAVYSWKNNA